MIRRTTRTYSSLLVQLPVLLFLFLSPYLVAVQAGNITASTDYGFGPLWMNYDIDGDTLPRCDNVLFDFGGGFGPYYLAAVNAGNKSTKINLETNTSASWETDLAEDSHVAFNLTDRAGASLQTDFMTVKSSDDKTCGNDAAYKAAPTGKTGSAGRGLATESSLIVRTVVIAGAVVAGMTLLWT